MVGAIAPRRLPALKHRRNHGAEASEARIMEGYEITAKQGNHTKAPAGTILKNHCSRILVGDRV